MQNVNVIKRKGRPSTKNVQNVTYTPSLIDFSKVTKLNDLDIDPKMMNTFKSGLKVTTRQSILDRARFRFFDRWWHRARPADRAPRAPFRRRAVRAAAAGRRSARRLIFAPRESPCRSPMKHTRGQHSRSGRARRCLRR